MDDLSGLSWAMPPANSLPAQQQQQQQTRNGGSGHGGAKALAGMSGGILQPTPVSSPKVKPPVPPVSSKPAHLQMGRNAGQAFHANTSTTTTNSLGSLSSLSSSSSNKVAAPVPTQPGRQPSSDVFGSLIPDFGKDKGGAKSLETMSLDERRRHLQQQAQQSNNNSGSLAAAASNRWDDFSMLSNSLLSTSPSPSPSPMRSATITTNSNPTPTAVPTSTFNPSGIQAPIPQGRPLPAFVGGGGVMSSAPRGSSPGSLLTPLQPSRSGSSSPAPTKDPFDSLLGGQSSRSTPSTMNQSLNTLRANTPPVQPSTQPGAADPWDLDFLANTGSTTSKTNGTSSSSPSSSLVQDATFDLGAFEKAVPERSTMAPPKPPRPSMVGSSPAVSSPPSSSASSLHHQWKDDGSSSPSSVHSTGKDSLVAMIVEMGFSAQQAKTALAMTPGGNDVEAAIDLLVQNKAAADELTGNRRNKQQQQQGVRPRERARTADAQRTDAGRRRDDRSGGNGPGSRGMDEDYEFDRRRRPPLQDEGGTTGAGQSSARTLQFQQQKDRFVESASAFGLSVFSKASDLYKQGKEKVQAVMEDKGVEDERAERLRRHRWVDEGQRAPGAYRDSDSEEEDDQPPNGSRSSRAATVPSKPRRELVDDYYDQRGHASTARRPLPAQQEASPRRVREREDFEGTYVSSSRRGGGGGGDRSKAMAGMSVDRLSSPGSSGSTTTVSKRQPAGVSGSGSSMAAKKPARPPRRLVSASAQQMEQSNRLKEKGNELFKLGQFGQAAEMYAQATGALPANHLTLVILHNNRAAALIKVGEYRETVEVCGKSIAIIQGPDGEGVHDEIPASAGVQLKEQLGKALMRRATAYENMEKYQQAKQDWTQLRELDPSHKQAIEGMRRCDKAMVMVQGGDDVGSPLKKKVASPMVSNSSAAASAVPVRSSPLQDMYSSVQSSAQQAKAKAAIQNSEGVSKLREAARQQEKEDDERLRVRDQVDMRMTQWKSGKEDNLRALIASLHTVLWEEAGWKAVGMHELVTVAQVKVKYMRAIGKMHPDKLGARTTVAQRMMANTIFSTLNSAWDAFKVQNNL